MSKNCFMRAFELGQEPLPSYRLGEVMKILLSEWSHVIVGSWNLAILNPQWVGTELFGGEQIDVEMEIGAARPSIRYIIGDVTVIPSPERVAFMSRNATDSAVASAENAARKLLQALPVTPIRAIGVNFGFVVDDVEPSAAALFGADDRAHWEAAGHPVESVSISRVIPFGERQLRLSLAYDDNQIIVKMNYHRECDAVIAGSLFKAKSVDLLRMSLDLLDDVYGFQLENSDDDA